MKLSLHKFFRKRRKPIGSSNGCRPSAYQRNLHRALQLAYDIANARWKGVVPRSTMRLAHKR